MSKVKLLEITRNLIGNPVAHLEHVDPEAIEFCRQLQRPPDFLINIESLVVRIANLRAKGSDSSVEEDAVAKLTDMELLPKEAREG